jgi:hypothetical protein
MLQDFSVTIIATGVAQRLATIRIPAAWINFQPLATGAGAPSNVAAVAIGGPDVALNKGQVINPGDTAVGWPVADINGYDLHEIWVTGTMNDGVQGAYFTR